MNWDESQMAASAFAKGHGGMSLGDQWSLAAMLREGTSSKCAPTAPTSNSQKDRKPGELSKEAFGVLKATSILLSSFCAIVWLIIWLVK